MRGVSSRVEGRWTKPPLVPGSAVRRRFKGRVSRLYAGPPSRTLIVDKPGRHGNGKAGGLAVPLAKKWAS
jgi:hypothetical protein